MPLFSQLRNIWRLPPAHIFLQLLFYGSVAGRVEKPWLSCILCDRCFCFVVKQLHKVTFEVTWTTDLWKVRFRVSFDVSGVSCDTETLTWLSLRLSPSVLLSLFLCFLSRAAVTLTYCWIPHRGERKQERQQWMLAAQFCVCLIRKTRLHHMCTRVPQPHELIFLFSCLCYFAGPEDVSSNMMKAIPVPADDLLVGVCVCLHVYLHVCVVNNTSRYGQLDGSESAECRWVLYYGAFKTLAHSAVCPTEPLGLHAPSCAYRNLGVQFPYRPIRKAFTKASANWIRATFPCQTGL